MPGEGGRRADDVMSGVNVTRGVFRMTVSVPDDLVGMPAEGEADGEWAAWLGMTGSRVDGRTAVVLVSVTVTAYTPPPGVSAAQALAARLRAQHPDGGALIEELATAGGSPAVVIRRVASGRAGGREVTTGQAQALVVYPGPGALGVVSAVCPDPADLERAAALVTGIATGMTVTGASAAA
jgi:hypothetical protein